jgi:lipopolysaccharide export LptBFGC system permease protein LptF
MIKKRMLRDIKRGKTTEVGLTGHLYRNREDLRTWFMRKVYADSQRLIDVQIVQQDAEGNIIKQWYAREARYSEVTKSWNLQRARYVEIGPDGRISKSELQDEIEIEGWRETPWRIASSVMNPDYLSVPELEDYLSYNRDFPEVRLAPYRTQLHYRWALPWVCLLVVFIAAPLGIVYSRRGILGGVALAIGLFFSLVFFSSLFVALGKGNRIAPWLATWGPMVAYFFIGLALLWFRSTNRDLPKIKLPWTS